MWGWLPLLAAAVLVVEVVSIVADWWVVRSDISLSPVAFAAVAFLVVASLRRRPSLSAAVLFVSAAVAVAVCGPVAGWGKVAALALSASQEEVVYRWALPAVLFFGLSRLPVRTGAAALAAAVAAAGVFAVLPGHVAQYGGSPMGPLPWVCMALLWTGMLWRGVPVAACAAHHMMLNTVAFSTAAGAPRWWWHVALLVPVALVVAAEAHSDHRRVRASALVAAPLQPA